MLILDFGFVQIWKTSTIKYPYTRKIRQKDIYFNSVHWLSMYLTSALDLYLAITQKKLWGPSYQVRAIQMSLFRFACIKFYRYLFDISSLFCEMFSFSLSGRHIRLIACCYFVWEPRVNNVISRGPILTQYCIPWICDKICQTATFTTRWHSNIFSVSRPLILILSRFKERESSHVFFTKCNIKSNTLWPLWRGINDEHGRRQMYRLSFCALGLRYCLKMLPSQ